MLNFPNLVILQFFLVRRVLIIFLKQSFPFELLSDPDEKVCKAFDVMKLKSMYGKEYVGVDRSTFIINEKGEVVREWRSVKVKGHVDEVLEAVKELT